MTITYIFTIKKNQIVCITGKCCACNICKFLKTLCCIYRAGYQQNTKEPATTNNVFAANQLYNKTCHVITVGETIIARQIHCINKTRALPAVCSGNSNELATCISDYWIYSDYTHEICTKLMHLIDRPDIKSAKHVHTLKNYKCCKLYHMTCCNLLIKLKKSNYYAL